MRRLVVFALLVATMTAVGASDLSVYHRREEQTFLTVPEWYIVYSPEEYAHFIAANPPSHFPYFQSVALFWRHYAAVCQASRSYPFNAGYHVMIIVIGSSYSVELIVKGVYENFIGRISEWTASDFTSEDRLAAQVAAAYVDFIKIRPWYEFDFWQELKTLWKGNPFSGPNKIRRVERRFFLSTEYGVKALYGWLIGKATHAAYDAERMDTLVHVPRLSETFLTNHTDVKVVGHRDDGTLDVTFPRYQPFTAIAEAFAEQGGDFIEIAGNEKILLTVVGDPRLSTVLPFQPLFMFPIPIEDRDERIGYFVPVAALGTLLRDCQQRGITVEHIYDY